MTEPSPLPTEQPPVTPPKAATTDRILAALGAAACLALLAVAAWLTPSSEGHGTHTQLKMPTCSWVTTFDKPCPTCGMTTAFAHAAEGNILASAQVQPAGALLAVATASAFWTLLHTAAFGSRIGRLFRPLWTTRWLITAAAVLVIAWIYKVITWNA